GSAMGSSDEPRDDFKEAVNAFNPNPIEKWTGRFNTENASVRRRTLNVPGFKSIPTVYTEATLPLNKDVTDGRLTVVVNINTVQPFTRRTPLRVKREKWYTCSSSQCSGSSSKCDCHRKHDEFRNKCISEGGRYTTESSKCRLGEKCGYCKQNVYLATLYLVAGSVGGGMYRESDKYQSALYPFYDISQGYEPRQPSSVNVRLYSEGDPFIAFQQLTEGREEFGIPNRTVGAAA
uniref:Putative uncharacterized protein TCIL3000_10_9440 n=1 Tax=Trypanosoma congolense (strain IL3000) TaxID=1068625 RepID=UPI000B54955E|nr:Chain A, Structure of Trypanosoma congolense Insect Stage Antigen [Trypanosoma congolense IL3000]5KMX_B Chain B, Structure of Trypanosoma congolense Insect Stage Antigen [Trypanosoma congolense IL3000]5KMX_C Chain C, Structure of Trypanosoma congolense Insect Stage Antigen [Trypanosoma congolense IL3000]5KMX_D Chain D, Structure of Trypanosoma congolense Insect Stage Antigen [Trypanosoma congolense IL3000]